MSTEPLLKIAAAYVRVSDERQDEYSPDSQLKLARERAARDGYLIPDEYVFYDDGISGKSAKRRDQFNRMIAMAKDKDHPFDRIYVWKFSRFARNQEESIVYKNLLGKKGVEVVSVSEPIPEGPFGSLIERIIEWMDEFYLINLATEVRRGMTEKASRGEPTCAPPYGYIMKDKKYYPDESGPADIIREMFQRYADGEGMRTIAVDLGAKGLRTKFGNPYDNRTIEYTLRNPCYIGKIRWSLDPARPVTALNHSGDHIMLVDGHHEPLISMELWERVQKRLDEQKRRYPVYARRDQPIEYMLKGLIRCSACGGAMGCTGVKSGKAQAKCLQCCAYQKGSCRTSHHIVIHRADAALIEGLEKAIGSKTFRMAPRKPQNVSKSGVDYDKLISVEEKKLERARAAYLAEIDTLEVYAKNKQTITKRIEELKTLKAGENVAEEIDVDAFAAKVSGVVEFIKRDDVTEKAKNEALRTIVEKVVYERAKNNLAIYFFVE